MNRLTLSHIDEELGSSEVASLCFLCLDFINKKRLEGIVDAKGLFKRLEEKGLLENHFFLAELLHTIRRADLLELLETDSRRLEETDANPILPSYRVMLYRIHENMSDENFEKMKFLLSDRLGRRPAEMCKSALDLFIEMEKNTFLSRAKLDILHETLLQMDQELVSIVNRYREETGQSQRISSPPGNWTDNRNFPNTPHPALVSRGCCTQPRGVGQILCPDAVAMPTQQGLDPKEYYTLTHNPRGLCVVFNNEEFQDLAFRNGTQRDADSLNDVFTFLGFDVIVYKNLTASAMRDEIKTLSERSFMEDDALVVCVLSHGELGSVYGTDDKEVLLKQLMQPFTSQNAPTLAGKPKMFFIQACQGKDFQMGYVPCPVGPCQQEEVRQNQLEEDAGPVYSETVPSSADFLVGMATVPNCKSFRSGITGSIYIQELCNQLRESANSSEMDDILSVLTRVNREVSKGIYKGYKQMPEPKYTFTKKLVLKPA